MNALVRCFYCPAVVDTEKQPAACAEAIFKGGERRVACPDCTWKLYRDALATGWDGTLCDDPYIGGRWIHPRCTEIHAAQAKGGLARCVQCRTVLTPNTRIADTGGANAIKANARLHGREGIASE